MTIVKRKINEKIKIKDLFYSLSIQDKENEVLHLNFELKVKTPYGYKKIVNAFRTEKQKTARVYFKNNETLEIGLNHLLRSNDEWKKIDNIKEKDLVETEKGYTEIRKVNYGKEKILYDISVEEVNCYYSNRILSHNSWLLCYGGKGALEQGKTVLHYTFELYEDKVGSRYDAIISSVPIDHIYERQDFVKDKLKSFASAHGGKLVIKFFPTKTATVISIRNHINKMMHFGINPDIIFVDYADLMNSRRNYEQKRYELESIYEDLRSLAGELQVPIVTACFHGDTEIKLVDGRSVKIKDAVNMCKKEQLYVYSWDKENKKLVMGKVNDVFKTGLSQKLFKLTLDNNKYVVVTENHNFMLRSGEYRQLKDLKIGDSLMPFTDKINSDNRRLIYDNNGSFIQNFRFVAENAYGKIPKFHQVHHLDHDKTNDNPSNLKVMTISEHYKEHSWFHQGSPASVQKLKKIYSDRMKVNNPSFKAEVRDKISKSRKGKSIGNDNPMTLEENKIKCSNAIKNSEKFKQYNLRRLGKARSINWTQFSSDKKAISLYGLSKEDRIKLHQEIALSCNDSKDFFEKTKNIPLRSSDKKHIWKHKNHKVKSIEFYGFDDVYNMEVEKYHNYALSCGIIVKNSQSNRGSIDDEIVTLDSIGESYAKAQVADVIISLSRRAEDKRMNRGKMFIAKNRAGQDGGIFPVVMNTTTAKIEVLEQQEGQVSPEQEFALKQKMIEEYKKYKGKKGDQDGEAK